MIRHHSLLILLLLFSILCCCGCSEEPAAEPAAAVETAEELSDAAPVAEEAETAFIADEQTKTTAVKKTEDVTGIFEGLEGNHTAVFSFDGIETAFHFEEPAVQNILFEAITGSSYTLSYYLDPDTGLYIIYEISES